MPYGLEKQKGVDSTTQSNLSDTVSEAHRKRVDFF